MLKEGAFIVLASLLTLGCEPHISQERRMAPAGPHDLGVLTELSDPTDVDQILRTHPEAQVRRLSPRHGLYEFFGVTEKQIAKVVPHAQTEANIFFSTHPQAMPGPYGIKLKDLERCVQDDHYPVARIGLIGLDHPANQPVKIELGTSLHLTAQNSAAHPDFPSQLKFTFMINSPQLAPHPKMEIPGNEIELKPEALGLTMVYLVVQDDRHVCSYDMLQVLVTANRPFHPRTSSGHIDLNRLTHLQAVSAPEAWALSEGEGQLIAIVDSGVDYNHPLLAPNIALNLDDTPDNDLDDDQNGFVDDYLGYDFVNQDPFPFDDDGHGTHVAGLAAGREIGLARNARILAIKAVSSVGGDVGTVAAAIFYAVDRHAKIINLSLGTKVSDPTLKKALKYAGEHDVLVVVAVGNGDIMSGLGFDIDRVPVYPASYPFENILTVGASDSINSLAPYSNFGKINMDVVAPGGSGESHPIYSAALENTGRVDLLGLYGTSMAAPIVTGIAAQVWAISPNLRVSELKQILLNSGEDVADLKPVTVSGKKINARSAIEIAQKRSQFLF